MDKALSVKEIEIEYKSTVQQYADNGNALTPASMIDLSLQLFQGVSAKGVSIVDEKDNDMLLFQYGTYDWGDDKGEHFSFEIARQFILNKNNDFYQLRFTLIFDPKDFKDCDSYERWSRDFTTIDEWANDIKLTEGYKLATSIPYKSYEISLERI